VTIDVPEVVRSKPAVAGATAWLDSLPDLVRSIEGGGARRRYAVVSSCLRTLNQ
jgi:hypothetical protein